LFVVVYITTYHIRPNKHAVHLQKHDEGMRLKISILTCWKEVHLTL